MTTLIEYPRLAAGFIALALLFIGFSTVPGGASLIASLFSHPESQIAPIQQDNYPFEIAKMTPSPSPLPSPAQQGLPREPIPRRNGPGRSAPGQGATALAQVDRVYVEKPDLFAARRKNQLVRSAQEGALDESGVIRTVRERSAAQATLVLDTDYRSGGKQFVRPKLTLKNDVVLWEGPLIEVGEDKDAKTAVIGEAQLKALIKQLKNAVNELLRAKAIDRKRR